MFFFERQDYFLATVAGRLLSIVLSSVQICRLLQVSIECLLLAIAKAVNLPVDLFAVLPREV